MKKFLFAILIGSSILASCHGGGGNDDKITFGEILASGWTYYQNAQYDSAYVLFGDAIAGFGTYPADSLARAHAGRGWSLAKTGDYAGAVTEFNQALTNQDAMAGLGFVYLAQNSYSNAITASLNLINANASYAFQYDPAISIADVRLCLAQAYFYTNNYTGVITQLDILAPGHGLTVNSPAADILAKLMELRTTV